MQLRKTTHIITPIDPISVATDDNESLSDNNVVNPRLPLSKWNDLIVDIYKTLLVQLQIQNENEQGGGAKNKSKLKSASVLNTTGLGLGAGAESHMTNYPEVDLLSNGDPKERLDHYTDAGSFSNQLNQIKVYCNRI